MLNLSTNFVVRQPGLRATSVSVTADLYQRLDAEYDGFKGHELIALHHFDSDWPTWEIHPKGDEIVVLVSGSGHLILEREGEHLEYALTNIGDYVIVPANTWHTARINGSTSMLFITPGEGTLNEVRS